MKYVIVICLVIAAASLKLTSKSKAISQDGNSTRLNPIANTTKALNDSINEPVASEKHTPEVTPAPSLPQHNKTPSNLNESTDDILSNDLLIDDNTLDNYTIVLETFNNTNIVQILGGSDFINATTPVNETLTVLLDGDASNGENWFISNKEEISKYITPINIKDDGSTTKFIPDVNAHIGISKEGTFAFNFKAIRKTKEKAPIELLFELKHPWDPLAIKTVIVSMTII